MVGGIHMSGYETFLTHQLAVLTGIIDETEAYDIQWEQAEKLYKEFINSDFDDLNESQYDCLQEFLVFKYSERFERHGQ